MIKLLKTSLADLDTLFEFQSQQEGIWMAAFTAENPADKEFYMNKWCKIVENPAMHMKTLWDDNRIIGSFIHFNMMDETHVSYWINYADWGKGYATEGLKRFLAGTGKRPLHARVAFDNIGSQRVLEKNGFQRIGSDKGFANARKMEIQEFVYLLSNE